MLTSSHCNATSYLTLTFSPTVYMNDMHGMAYLLKSINDYKLTIE